MPHAKTIAMSYQKGGVGKTISLGVGLARAGKEVLLMGTISRVKRQLNPQLMIDSAFIRSRLLPQNRNSVLQNGFS